jgi:hypothetical protein
MIRVRSRIQVALLVTALFAALTACDFFLDLDEVPLTQRDVSDDATVSDVSDTDTPDVTADDVTDVLPTPDVPDVEDDSDVIEDTADLDATEPDTHQPDTSVPDTSVPDSSVPDTSLPDTNVEDADSDAADVVEDIAEDVIEDVDTGPPAPVCPIDFGTYSGLCSLVNQDCTFNDACNLGFIPNEPLPVPRCNTPWGFLRKDATCTSSGATPEERCERGTMCASWPNPDGRGLRCSAYCLVSTNAGCTPDEYCVAHSVIRHVPDAGLCVRRCDPYEPNTCGTGRSCVADHQYRAPPTPQPHSCFAEFRCIAAGTPSSPDYMSTCARAAHHLVGNGCAQGLTCYPLPAIGDRCVKPCRSQQDCDAFMAGSTCETDPSNFGLSYCRPGPPPQPEPDAGFETDADAG